jgi:hypothetical protein
MLMGAEICVGLFCPLTTSLVLLRRGGHGTEQWRIAQFIKAVKGLSIATPQSDRLDQPTGHDGFEDRWISRLEEYLTPGYYDRKNAVDDAKWAYQHLANGGMIVWLNGAAGENPRIISAAIEAREPPQTEAKYARRVLPWGDVAELLFKPKS